MLHGIGKSFMTPEMTNRWREFGTDRNRALVLIGMVVLAVMVLSIALTFLRAGTSYPINVNGKYGFIDKRGHLTVNPQFDDAEQFNDGYAAVRMNDKWGYIDHAGKLAITPQYDFADPFSDGLALTGVGKRLG